MSSVPQAPPHIVVSLYLDGDPEESELACFFWPAVPAVGDTVWAKGQAYVVVAREWAPFIRQNGLSPWAPYKCAVNLYVRPCAQNSGLSTAANA